MRRRGFTLVEMLLATGLLAVVVAPLALSLSGVFRLSRENATGAELALRLRSLREQILFRGAGGTSGGSYGGLLSATNVVISGANYVEASFPCVAAGDQAVAFGAVEELPDRLAPVRVEYGDGLTSGTVSSNLLYITLSAEARLPGGATKTVRERVVVPLFGELQSSYYCGVLDNLSEDYAR